MWVTKRGKEEEEGEEKRERKEEGEKGVEEQLSTNSTCTYVHSYNSGNVLNMHNSAAFLNTYDRVVVHNAVSWKVSGLIFNP